MGLVEGPGGLGQGGAPATLGEDSRDTEGKYEEYGYNAQLSDRISLDRSIPDYRPKKCVHLQFCFLALACCCSPTTRLCDFRQFNPLCSWLVLFLWMYTSWGRTLCQRGVIFLWRQCFFFHHALCLITHKRWVWDDKQLRGAAEDAAKEDTTHLFYPPPLRTGCSQSVRLLDFAVSSPAIGDGPALWYLKTNEARNPNWPSTLFNLKRCIFTLCLQSYSGLTWQRLQRLLLAAE